LPRRSPPLYPPKDRGGSPRPQDRLVLDPPISKFRRVPFTHWSSRCCNRNAEVQRRSPHQREQPVLDPPRLEVQASSPLAYRSSSTSSMPTARPAAPPARTTMVSQNLRLVFARANGRLPIDPIHREVPSVMVQPPSCEECAGPRSRPPVERKRSGAYCSPARVFSRLDDHRTGMDLVQEGRVWRVSRRYRERSR